MTLTSILMFSPEFNLERKLCYTSVLSSHTAITTEITKLLAPQKKPSIAFEFWGLLKWPFGAPRLITWYFRTSLLFSEPGSAIWLCTKFEVYYGPDFKKMQNFFHFFDGRFRLLRICKESERDNRNISGFKLRSNTSSLSWRWKLLRGGSRH